MTPSQLKIQYYKHNPDGHFFDRETMKFFGDTMKNFRCRKTTLPNGKQVYELYRKHPVKTGLNTSHFFDMETFDDVFEQ